jgi:hypothetical protein
MKLFIAAAVVGAVGIGASINTASACETKAGITGDKQAQTAAVADDLSAKRKRRRASVRVYTYPETRPYPYGYYGPMYYDRPYRRPPAVIFGLGSRW